MKVFRIFGIALLALLAWSSIASAQEPFTAGTWTPTKNAPASAVAHALLLNDGSVLVNSMFFENHSDPWYRLVPDKTGSYINGTWSNAGSLPSGYNPLYFASSLLPSGQVVVVGGEYNNGGAVWTTLGALYNPSSKTWTSLTAPSGWTTVGDAQSIILPNGHMMMANCCTTQEAILTLTGITATWATTGTGKFDDNDEEGWTLLPGGKILTVDAYVPSGCCKMGYQIYDPTTGAWTTPTNNTVVNLVDPSSLELGPMPLLPNGTVFAAGATTNNAIYTPSTGTWASAPKFGGTLDIADGPAAVLPDGNALFDTSPGVFNTGSKFFEWDGTTLNATAATSNAAIDSSYVGNMVVLPTGQVLFTDFSSTVEIYTPAGQPCAGCAPTIKSVATSLTHGSKNNKISGTQFNGLTQGAYYGDDNQSSTNFPIVRITDSKGVVVYCKTHSWLGGVATGTKLVSAQFDIPLTINLGAASLVVVTNGIPSKAKAITII
jgi:Galactose oxidase, central domain